MVLEAEEMTGYAWLGWPFYIWNINTQSYIKTISLLLDCGVTGGVVDSKYGNLDFFKDRWMPAVERFGPIFNTLNQGWYPVLVWFCSLDPLVGPLTYLILSAVYSADYQEQALAILGTLSVGGAGPRGGRS